MLVQVLPKNSSFFWVVVRTGVTGAVTPVDFQKDKVEPADSRTDKAFGCF